MKDTSVLTIIGLVVVIVVGMLRCNHGKETVVCELSEGREAEMDALCNEVPQEKLDMYMDEGQIQHVPVGEMPEYKPKTVEDCISHLFEVMSFEELIIWADKLEVPHCEEDWLKSAWIEREDALRQEVEEVFGAMIN